jgi:hypothetical protein
LLGWNHDCSFEYILAINLMYFLSWYARERRPVRAFSRVEDGMPWQDDLKYTLKK